MTIGFSEIAILAMLVCGLSCVPAPAFIWHRWGRWLVFSTSLVVMLVCAVACSIQLVYRKLTV